MEDTNLVLEALKFMVLGMGIVFLFLVIMIIILKLQTKLIMKFFPLEEKIKTSKLESKTKTIHTDSIEKVTIAAITAAIIHHNNQKGYL